MPSYAAQVAYSLAKESAVKNDQGSIATPIVGGLGGALGPIPAFVGGSLTGGLTGPDRHAAQRGLASGGGAALGSVLGMTGGAYLGGALGRHLSDKNRDTTYRAAILGALLGGAAGGAGGAHLGRSWSLSHEKRSAYDFGKTAAVEKLGLSPILSMIGRGMLAGGGIGAASGGLTGFLSAPQGEGGRGFLRGALAGGATGALGGGLAGGLGGRAMMKANPRLGAHAIQGSSIRNVVGQTPQSMNAQQILTEFPRMRPGFLGAAGGAAGAGILGGGLAGAAATPEAPTWSEQLRRRLGV